MIYAGTIDTAEVPTAASYTAQVDGTERAAVNVEVGTSTVTLTLASAVTSRQSVTVTYTPGRRALRHVKEGSLGGRRAIPLSSEAVTNESPSNARPLFAWDETGDREVPEGTAVGSAIGAPLDARDADGDALTYAIFGGDAQYFELDASSGELQTKAALDYESRTEYAFTVSIRDSKDPQDQADSEVDDELAVTVTVINVDEDGSLTLSSEPPMVGTALTATLTDPDEVEAVQSWSWKRSANRNSWTVIASATSGSYVPTADTVGQFLRVTARYNDGHGPGKVLRRTSNEPVAPMPITNTAPFFPNIKLERSVQENSPSGTTVGLPVTAMDAENGTLLYTLAGGGTSAFTVDSSSGQIQVGPNTSLDYETRKSYSVTITASDPFGASASKTVSIAVQNIDERPEISGPTTTTLVENATRAVATYRAVDPEGEVVSWSLEGDDWSHFTITAGTLRFNQPPDYEARADQDRNNNYQVTVVADDQPLKGRLDVTVSVTPVDESPQITGPTEIEVNEHIAGRSWTFTTIDPEDEQLNLSLGGADSGAFTFANGVLRFARVPDFESPVDADRNNVYEVTVTATDGANAASYPVMIRVVNVDEPGSLRLPSEQPLVGTALTATLTDPDQMEAVQSWAWERSANRSNWTVIASATSGSYVPTADAEGQFLRVTASYNDGHGPGKVLQRIANQPVAPMPITNTAPFFPNIKLERSVQENSPSGTTVGLPVTAMDAENGTLLYTLAGGGTSAFTVDSSSGQIQVGPNTSLDYETRKSYSVTITASDPFGASASKTVSIAVQNIDERPEISGPTTTTLVENATRAVATYRAVDPEGEVVSWSLEGDDWSHFTITAGTLRFNQPPDYEARADQDRNNNYQVTVVADDQPLKGRLDVTVSVTPVDESPQITGPTEIEVNEHIAGRSWTFTTIDPEDEQLNLSLGGADSGAFTFANGVLRFARVPDFESPVDADRNNVYEVTVTATDGANAASYPVMIRVVNVDEPGSLRLPSEQPLVGTALTATLTDPDQMEAVQSWAWERSANRSNWTVIASATSGSYVPTADAEGQFLRVTASYNDGHGPGKVLQRIANQPVAPMPITNTAPFFPNIKLERSVQENSPSGTTVGLPVTAMDAENGTLLYTLAGGGTSAFTVDSSSGQIQVGPNTSLDYETRKSYSVTITASDPFGASASKTVSIAVVNINEPPVAEDDSAVTDEDVEVTISVLGNDRDPEDVALTVTSVSNPGKGVAAIGADNRITYQPSPNLHGADKFTYTVTDRNRPSSATVSVTITPTNDPPMFATPSITRSISEQAEDGDDVGPRVTATDVDVGDVLTYSMSVSSDFAIVPETGQIVVADGAQLDADAQPVQVVTVHATDPDRAVASVGVVISVTAGPGVGGSGGGGGGGGSGGPSGPSPSIIDFEWTVKRDIEELDSGNDWPTGLWSDGATLWILENGQGADDEVYAYDPETGERIEEREFTLADSNRAPRGIWSDGSTVWVSDSGRDRVFAYTLAGGARVESREIELAERNGDARGVWSDSETMSVLDGSKNALFAYDLATGELLGEYELVSANGDPHGIWSDRVTVWVSDHGAKRLFAYRLPARPEAPAAEDAEATPLEQVRDEEFTELSGASNNSPRGIWSDGDFMYVADESDDRVYTYNMPDATDARLASLSLSGVDFGEFDPGRTDYEGSIAEGVTETTVGAEAMQRRTDVAIDPPDADVEGDGHQVGLEGLTEITVTVTSADGSRTRVYRVAFPAPSAAAPAASCLRGAVTAGFSLVVHEGGSIEDLEACAQSRSVTALYVPHDGEYVPYILGAADFVNEEFVALNPEGLAALTPLIAKSEGPPSPAPASEDVPEFGADCLRGEIGEDFNLVLYEGGSVEDLDSCAQSRGVTAVYALVDGEYVPYILGAPDFVNEAFVALFPDGLPAIAPLVATSDGPPEAN